jgi:hypothetical protein
MGNVGVNMAMLARRRASLLAGAVLGLSILAHFAGGAEMDATAALLVADHLFNVASASLFALYCLAVGQRMLRLRGVPLSDPVARVTFAMTLGCAATATALLIVCALAGVTAGILAATLAAGGVACRRELAAAPTDVVYAIRSFLSAHQPGWPRRLAAGSFALVSLTLLLLALPPAVDWDSLAYHLEVPAQWLRAGQMHLPQDNFHAAFVGLAHVLYLPLLALGSNAGPAILNAVVTICAGLATFALARDVACQRVGAIAFWLLCGVPLLFLVGITPRVDIVLLLFLVAAHHALLIALREPTRGDAFVLAAVILGGASGVKYLALPYAVALSPIILGGAVRMSGHHWKRALVRTSLFSLIAAVVAAPWLIKNWLLVGSPFHPFFVAPIVEPWIGRLNMSGTADPMIFRVLENIRADFNLTDLILSPERLTPDADARWSTVSLALMLAPLALVGKSWRIAAVLGGPVAGYTLLVLAASGKTNLRYLMPVIPPLAVMAAIAVAPMFERASWRAWLTAAVLGICAAPAAVAVGGRLKESRTLAVTAGMIPRHQYLRDYWETGPYYRSIEWMNANLPADATVLLLFEARGFYLERPHLKDMLARNWPLVAPYCGQNNCRLPGVTHIFVNDYVADYFRRRGMDFSVLQWKSFDEFSSRCLELIIQRPGGRVYGFR